MTEKIAIHLGNVQKTLFLPLWGRAFETQKEDPLLVDEAAVEIMQKVDFDFSSTAENMHVLSQMAWIQRSLYIDRVVKGFLEKHPSATIVNLGCGLDTTFERTDNGRCTWYDLDLPDVIELRRSLIKESERRTTLPTSLFEKDWLTRIQVRDHILFIAAGVLYYFEESEVKAFLVRLADTHPASQIIFDASSPKGVEIANRKVITSSGLDEKSFLKWGLKSEKELLLWDPRFCILATHFYFRKRIRSFTLKNRLLGLFSDAMKVQYMIHLEL
jgi:O-methyltransferase involved in polyketide biosynthesis